MINEKAKKDLLPRLKKIEGQIRGIQRMVEKERYYIDIINQLTAAERALDQVNLKVMRRHIESCVTDAIKSDGGGPIVEELMETIYKQSYLAGSRSSRGRVSLKRGSQSD